MAVILRLECVMLPDGNIGVWHLSCSKTLDTSDNTIK